MKLSVEHILDVPGRSQQLAGELDLTWVKRREASLFPGVLAAAGEVVNRAGVVTLRYQISGVLSYECERCLMQTEQPFTQAFSHIVVRALEDEELDDAFLTAPDGVLDLSEIAGADLILSLPQILLCREDCKGLCMVCGTDLNQKNCGCR